MGKRSTSRSGRSLSSWWRRVFLGFAIAKTIGSVTDCEVTTTHSGTTFPSKVRRLKENQENQESRQAQVRYLMLMPPTSTPSTPKNIKSNTELMTRQVSQNTIRWKTGGVSPSVVQMSSPLPIFILFLLSNQRCVISVSSAIHFLNNLQLTILYKNYGYMHYNTVPLTSPTAQMSMWPRKTSWFLHQPRCIVGVTSICLFTSFLDKPK